MQSVKAETFDWKSLLSIKGASLITASVIAIAGVTTFTISNSITNSNLIVKGVKAEGFEIAGMTENGARNHFSTIANERAKPLNFTYGEQTFTIKPDEIKLTPNVDEATQEAYRYGRSSSSFVANMQEQIRCALNGRNITLSAKYDENLLNEKLNTIANQINRQPVNAYVELGYDGSILKYAGVIGKKLDTEKIAESLKNPLTKLNIPNSIELIPEDIMPFITTEDVTPIDSIIGQYSTTFNPGDRGDNIAIAAYALNDKLVKPGWSFSFNDTVGQRTYSAGYKNAGVIINGKPEVDVGGGVCQVSSTLYNAVLLAGLTPTVRTPHFFPSTYVAPGRDATVADGIIDFQFRNDLPHNVYLLSSTYGSTLTVYVLGTHSDLNGASIHLENEGSDMSPSIYRVWSRNGQVIRDEFLHTDVYHEPVRDEN